MKNLTHHFTTLPLYHFNVLKVFCLVAMLTFGLAPYANSQCAPCTGTTYIVPSNAGLVSISDWLQSNGLSANDLQNSCIRVQSDIEIDVDFTFQNVDFRMFSGRKILVKTGFTFSAIESNFYACNFENQRISLWQGIFAPAESGILFEDCNISDAYTAITGLYAQIQLTRVNFDRNHNGIYISDSGFPGSNGSSSYIFNQLTFDCTDPLFGSFDNDNFPLQTSKEHSNIAIEVNSVQFLDMAFLNPNQMITIKNHHIGLFAFYSYALKARNLDISEMHSNLAGVGSRGVVLDHCHDALLEDLNIVETSIGVYAEYSNSEIAFSTIVADDTGIATVFDSGSNIHHNPRIIGIETGGIIVNGVTWFANAFYGFRIEDNSVIRGKKAISLNTCLRPYFIQNNFQVIGGLFITGGLWGVVKENNLASNGGINLNSSFAWRKQFIKNTVQSSNSGVRADYFTNIYLCCNDFNNNTVGMEFVNSCNNAQLWNSDLSNNSGIGLFVWEESIIGNQINVGINWNAETAPLDGNYVGNDVPIAQQLNHITLAPESLPTIGQFTNLVGANMMESDWINVDMESEDPECPTDGTLCGGEEPLTVNTPVPDISNIAQLNLNVLNAEVPTSTEEETQLFTQRLILFDRLAKNEDLRTELSSLEAFYQANLSTEVGELAHIQSRLDALTSLTTEQTAELELLTPAITAFKADVSTNLAEIAAENSSVAIAALQAERQVLFENNQGILTAFEELKASIDAEKITEVELLQVMNEAISTNTLAAQNLRTVYESDMMLLLGGVSSLSEVLKSEVEQIAAMCPSVGGLAVYRARRTVQLWDLDLEQATIWCDFVGLRTSEEEFNTKKDLEVVVSPNPVQSRINVQTSFEVDESAQALISDLTGRLVLDTRISILSDGSAVLSLPNLLDGIYTISILSKNQKAVSTFSIQH